MDTALNIVLILYTYNGMNFIPRSPEQMINGHIISVFNGVSQVGQYQIVVYSTHHPHH